MIALFRHGTCSTRRPRVQEALGKETNSVILFYAAQNNLVVENLERQLSSYRVTRCRSFEILEKRLRCPRHKLEIVLVVVGDELEMYRIEDIQELTRDLRLVLVLPGRDSKMVAHAHNLAPRFIAYADHGFEQIGAVLKKMLSGPKPGLMASNIAMAKFQSR